MGDETEVHPKTDRDNYIGVSYNKKQERWRAVRWSKNEKQSVFKGYYKDEIAAAHASDALARKLIKNGEQNHRLNFPDDDKKVHPKFRENKRKRLDGDVSQIDENLSAKFE